MSSFLRQIAENLREKHGGDFVNIAVILPTQRSKHFLISELSKDADKPIFLPNIMTISDFIEKLSPYKNISKEELLIDLYTEYTSLETAKKDDFAKFLSWATMFLQDINDIDMQMKNAGDIFTNLANIKELDITLFKDAENKESKRQKYLDFYYSLNNLYEKLRKSLEEKSSGYTGMIYRNVAENIDTYSERTDFKKYIFAGFNAFTPSEASIVRHYLENGKAEIFFDLDSFYYETKIPDTLPPYSRNISDLIHLTIKRLNLTERDIHFVGNHYRETAGKEITVTGIPKGFHQVQYAVGLLKSISEKELDKTAVIFADESLIVPFLHSYDCTNANITMGYPIQGLPAYNLLQLAIQLVKNGTRMSDGETELKFYHKDILAFFRHPVISKNLFQTESGHEKFINTFISMNTIMVSAETIATLITNAEKTNEEFQGKIIEFLKQVTAEGLAPLEALHFLFDQLAAENPQQNTLKHSIFRLIRDNLAEIGTLLRKFPATVGFTIETIELFINSRFSGLTLTQKGNRNQGLQVMGVLETRALDFDNIIMLSVNEGNLPVGKTQNSLIIYEVRKHFGLPTYHEKEAVSAYHFFRLLQRAKKIDLIYDNDTRDSLCEKSRFINQLRFENQKQKTGFKFTEKTISTQPSLKNNSQELNIQKNDSIIGLLRKMSYSPTKLSTYITCPLKFYLENIAEIKPPQNINEDIDSSVIGTVVHGILEKIFIELKNLAKKKESTTN